jgi:UDP-2-acetamido-3-amino-2,3-dideoxy-glucuronate N-acetyltransferase
MPSGVDAHGGSYLNSDVTDITVTNLSFPGGTKAHIFVSWLHPYKEQKLVVIGDRRMAFFDDMSPIDKLLLYEHEIKWLGGIPTPAKNGAHPVKITMEEPLNLECQHFLECMQNRKIPKTDGKSGLDVLKVLEAAQRSLNDKTRDVCPSNKRYFVHQSSIVEDFSHIGAGTKVWHFSHIMPYANVGRNCTIGQNVFIGDNTRIGDNVKIQNNVSIFAGVTLEDNVFCGPSCVFTNVINPRSEISRKDEFKSTLVQRGASIGANATIICGTTIGRYAFVGAGSVVTKNVPDYALVHGVPAEIKGWICQCGQKINFDHGPKAECSNCSSRYIMVGAKYIVRLEVTDDTHNNSDY